jgi:hypothetical protein
VAAGEAGAAIVGVGGSGAGQERVGAEAAGTDGGAGKVFGFQFVGDPRGGFGLGVVAEEEPSAIGELLLGSGAGGEAEAMVLGGESRGEGGEQGGEGRKLHQ